MSDDTDSKEYDIDPDEESYPVCVTGLDDGGRYDIGEFAVAYAEDTEVTAP